MRKLTLALVAGCMSAAVAAGAYAATGSPADTDKAGRAGPGTAAGQMGAADPSPGKAGPAGVSKGGTAAAGTSAGTAGAASSSSGTGASASSTPSGSSATAGSMGDDG